jgi:SAM-dependent methyltransferase
VKQLLLSEEEILIGYDVISHLYPNVPPMMVWRAWEYAAYQHYSLTEPVLDVGCGDGRYFQLVFPNIHNVVGVDMDADTVIAARRSGVYREVHQSPAHQMPLAPASFRSAFANCSLEHMDHLGDVLKNINQSLEPGGTFLLSVVTDKFVEWATLPLLIATSGELARARSLAQAHSSYHHLMNALAPEQWIAQLHQAGFDVLEHRPVLPEMTSRLFLFLDHLWHVRHSEGEVGDLLHTYLQAIPNFSQGFRQVMAGVMKMEYDTSLCSGAVFWARKHDT